MKKIRPYLLLMPLLFLGLIFLMGLINVLVQSLGYIKAFGLQETSFFYYAEILKTQGFLASLKSSLWVALISSVIAALLGTALAALLVYTSRTEGRSIQIVKFAILVPHTIVALFAISLLSQNGLLARLCFQLGLIESQEAFPLLLYSQNNFGVILAYIWKEVPFVAYFCLSLMSSVNSSLGEAAENLGASKLYTFFHIVLPLSLPSIKRAFLIILTFSFGAYDLPFLLGPTLPKALPVLAHIEYTHPDLLHRPYAMAMNGMILVFTWLIFALYQGFNYYKKRRRI